MAARLQWWVIPGGIFVLLHVVTLGSGDGAGDRVPLDASASFEHPTVQEASSLRLPAADGIATGEAFVVQLPADCRGQRGTMTLWRRIGGSREVEPWLSLKPRVRSDGTIPIAGLAAGKYDVALTLGAGASARTFTATGAACPGTLALSVAAAPGR